MVRWDHDQSITGTIVLKTNTVTRAGTGCDWNATGPIVDQPSEGRELILKHRKIIACDRNEGRAVVSTEEIAWLWDLQGKSHTSKVSHRYRAVRCVWGGGACYEGRTLFQMKLSNQCG